MIRIAPLFAAVALGAAAFSAPAAPRSNARAEAALTKTLGDRVAGKPVNCIPLSQIRSSRIFDGTAILYEVGDRYYVNRPRSGGTFLDADDILVSRSTGSQLCSLDLVRLIDRTSRFPQGSIGLGEFVPYTRVKAKG